MQKVDLAYFVKNARLVLNLLEAAIGLIIILGLVNVLFFLDIAKILLNLFVEQFNVVVILAFAWLFICVMGFLGLVIVVVPFAILPIGLAKKWSIAEMDRNVERINEKFSFPAIRIAASFVVELTAAAILGIIIFEALCLQSNCYSFNLSNLFVFFGQSVNLGFFNELPQQLILATLGFYAILRSLKFGSRIVELKLKSYGR